MTGEIRNKIEWYGAEVDRLSMKQEYEQLKRLLNEMALFAKKDDEAKNDAALYYYLGTGYGEYSNYIVKKGNPRTDANVIELRRWSMFYLRKGMDLYDPVVHTDPRAKLRILTNYANECDSSGRVLEALRIFRQVLQINSSFSIALGNYGKALQFLANMVNDSGHYKKLHQYAYRAITKALSIKDPDMYEQAIIAFQKTVDEYQASSIRELFSDPIVNDEYKMGNTEEEIAYRKWCLRNHLYLNPLNEVIELETLFAHDPLTITSYIEDICATDSISGNDAEPPRWFAMLNQLKEEYAYARYLCYAGSELYGDVHFADKDVKLSLASYDYSNYSIRIEQLKSSFRILYSMLDQISFFVNDYWKIGLEERKATAFNIFRAKNYPKDNLVLNSLYWVLSEFYEKYGDSETPSEKHLGILRNALEHKFVKVHEYQWNRKLQLESDSFYHISEDDLKKYTMRLLELAREALMYLVYAIGVDNSKRGRPDNAGLMPLSDFPDEWKL